MQECRVSIFMMKAARFLSDEGCWNFRRIKNCFPSSRPDFIRPDIRLWASCPLAVAVNHDANPPLEASSVFFFFSFHLCI